MQPHGQQNHNMVPHQHQHSVNMQQPHVAIQKSELFHQAHLPTNQNSAGQAHAHDRNNNVAAENQQNQFHITFQPQPQQKLPVSEKFHFLSCRFTVFLCSFTLTWYFTWVCCGITSSFQATNERQTIIMVPINPPPSDTDHAGPYSALGAKSANSAAGAGIASTDPLLRPQGTNNSCCYNLTLSVMFYAPKFWLRCFDSKMPK